MTNPIQLVPHHDPNARYFVGLDLGQRRDYTAIAVVERTTEFLGGRNPVTMEFLFKVHNRLRYLERVPLGTPYPDIVDRVRSIVTHRNLFMRCDLVVDATGVGTPVVDMIRAERLRCELFPVYIHGGDVSRRDGNNWKVPKRELITGLQLMLEMGSLELAEGMEHGETLVKELRDMRVEITLSGQETYGAWRSNQHDDLVFAVALAVWRANAAPRKRRAP